MIIRKTHILGLLLFLIITACGCSAYTKNIKKGRQCLTKKNYKEALKYLSLAVNLNPEDKKAYHFRADALFHLKEYEKCISDISKVIQKTKKPNAKMYALRADSFFALKKYKSALTDYNTAIKLDFQDSTLYHKRGLFFIAIEAFKRAKTDLKYAIYLDPKNDRIYCDLGKYYLFRKQYKKAIEYLSQAVELNPVYDVSHYFLGHAYLGRKEKSQAFEQCAILGKLKSKLQHKLLKRYLKQKDSIWEKKQF